MVTLSFTIFSRQKYLNRAHNAFLSFYVALSRFSIPHILMKSHIFMDFDIETVSDVLSLLFKLDDQIDMKFEADKDDEGNFKPSTVKLSFKNNLINKKLCTYMKALEIRENMISAKDEYSEEEYAVSLQHINENIEEIKLPKDISNANIPMKIEMIS